MTDDELRQQLGKLVRQLLKDEEEEVAAVTARLLEHLGHGARELPVLVEELHGWDLPNLQLGLDAALSRPDWEFEIVGLAGHAAHYHGLGLADLLTGSDWVPGAGSPTYVNAPVGPGRTMPCLALGLILVRSPAGPLDRKSVV